MEHSAFMAKWKHGKLRNPLVLWNTGGLLTHQACWQTASRNHDMETQGHWTTQNALSVHQQAWVVSHEPNREFFFLLVQGHKCFWDLTCLTFSVRWRGKVWWDYSGGCKMGVTADHVPTFQKSHSCFNGGLRMKIAKINYTSSQKLGRIKIL